MSVHKPDAVQNGVLREVDISKLEPATYRTNNRPVIIKAAAILSEQRIQDKNRSRYFLISTTKLIAHSFELVIDKSSFYCAVLY